MKELWSCLPSPALAKPDYLPQISSQLGVVAEKASIFGSKTSVPATNVLVLDALDEVVKLDFSGIEAVLVKARETGASKVVLASRSSEWEEAQSVFIRDCFGTDPMVVRLQPFNDAEQEKLFLDYVPGEEFPGFKSELEKFELQPLLGKPPVFEAFHRCICSKWEKVHHKKQDF